MNDADRYFGTALIRELTADEMNIVSGGVVLTPGDMSQTDTGTDNGYQCDADNDWVGNAG